MTAYPLAVPPSCWSRAQRRAVGTVLALLAITLALLGFRTHAQLIALTAIAMTSLAGTAACLRQRTRWTAPTPASEIAFGPQPAIVRFADERPQVFCAGWLRPRVFVSTAALIDLPNEELRAGLDHQRQHARRRDPLRLLAMQAFADSLPFIPVLRPLVHRYQRRLEAAAIAAATRTGASAAAARDGTVECRFAGSAEVAERPATARPVRVASTAWAVAAALALGALILHTGALIDLSRLDPTAPGGQLCLIAIVTLIVLAAAIVVPREPPAVLEP